MTWIGLFVLVWVVRACWGLHFVIPLAVAIHKEDRLYGWAYVR